MKRNIGIVFVALGLLLTLHTVSADPVFNGQIGTIGANDTKDFDAIESYTAYGGNITNFNVSVELETYHWVGFWGRVTYGLVLEGAGDATFYSWGTQSPASGTVMFSNSSNVDWGSITSTSADEREQEDTILGLTGASDAVNVTFTLTNTAALVLAGVPVASGASPSVNTSSNGGDAWETILLSSGADKVYASPINPDNENYAGNAADYQAMVPVSDATNTREYYVYLSLDPSA